HPIKLGYLAVFGGAHLSKCAKGSLSTPNRREPAHVVSEDRHGVNHG
ncbi:hypothetical protein I553_3865, partial [Mycobacterium xenopi 4042]